MDKICRGSLVGDLHNQGFRIVGATEDSRATRRGSHVTHCSPKLERTAQHHPREHYQSDTFGSRYLDRSPSREPGNLENCMQTRGGTTCLSPRMGASACLSPGSSPRLCSSAPSGRRRSGVAACLSPRPGCSDDADQDGQFDNTHHRYWRNARGLSPSSAPKQWPVAVRRDDDPPSTAKLSKELASAPGPRQGRYRLGARRLDSELERVASLSGECESEVTAGSAKKVYPPPPRCAESRPFGGGKRPALRLGNSEVAQTSRGLGRKSMSCLQLSPHASDDKLTQRKSLGGVMEHERLSSAGLRAAGA